MGFEIDFIPVGDGERGGDAITFRYGNLHGERSEQVVVVIDGGTKDSGDQLVEHIKKFYQTDQIDAVISSHPDSDHSSGLSVVLEKMKVKSLWMHRPWEHAQDIKDSFKDGRITGTGLKESLKKSLEDAYELESIAKRKEIPIYEPFSDSAKAEHPLIILNPSVKFYEALLPNFRETPEPKESAALPTRIVTAVKEFIKWIAESWGIETLTDPQEGETSAENNTSVMLLLQIDGARKLFMADAGVEAIREAISKAIQLGIDLKAADFLQVPHHGSKHNVGPTILDGLIGPKLGTEQYHKTSVASVPKDGDPKHPSRKVSNAFKRRGANVFVTKGNILRSFKDAPARPGWTDAVPLPFYDQVAE